MLTTERLLLRVASREEMERLLAAQTDPELIKAYGEMLQGCLEHPELWAWYAVWLIERQDGVPVGDLCFKGLGEDGSVEIGYGILEEQRCRGYAAEAVSAAVRWALDQPGVSRVEAETDPENRASQRVLEKCGFAPTGDLGEEGPRFVYAGPKANAIRRVSIVSLSSGVIGEESARRRVNLGLERLQSFGLEVRFTPHARRGRAYVKAHPEDRAADLLEAFRDPKTDMILCAIGGDDTYRLLPCLFDHGELREAIRDKVFLGFSDTTINHFMLHKLGLRSFYGQSFLADVCDPGRSMLPYTEGYFRELIRTGTIREIRPSALWYEERSSYGPEQLGTSPVSHPDRGFELLQGPPVFSGRILGGCIDSMFDLFDGGRYGDMPVLGRQYELFPPLEDWRGRILLLESSEEKMPPEQYRQALRYLKGTGIFGVISGILVGKPMDETYDGEYRQLLVEEIGDPSLPILCNLNIGHATPRCIMPFGVQAEVDAEKQRIRFEG